MSIQRGKPTIGQSLVEFAMIIPTLLMIILGVFEFGRVLQVWLTVQNCAQNAARFATTGEQSVAPSVDMWDSARLSAIKAEARCRAVSLSIDDSAGPSSPGYFHVFVYGSDPPVQGAEYPGGPNARVAVDVVFNHPLIMPLANRIASYITLRAHAEMINEQFRHPGYGTPVGVLPPTIFPTPEPTNTPAATATSGVPPTFTATVPTPTPTLTYTTLPTYTTAPTQTSTTIPPTAIMTKTATHTPTSTPCPWLMQCP
jgi:Flp pilus assembly protein TadG